MQPSVAHPTTAQQSPAVDPHRLRQWRDALHSLLEQSSVRVDTMLEVLDQQQQQQPHHSPGATEEGQRILPLPSSAPSFTVSPLYNDGDSPFGVDGLRQCVVQLQYNTNNNNNSVPDTASRAALETTTTTTAAAGGSATSGHSSSSPILSNDHRGEGESEFEQLRASDLQLVQYHHHHHHLPATASSTSSSLPNAGGYFTQSPPRRPLLVRRDASDVFFAEEEEQEGLPLQQPCQQQQPSHAPVALTPTPSSTTIVGVVVPRLQLERPDKGLPYVHSGLSASGSSAWTLLPTPRSPHVPHNRPNGGGGGGALSLPATPSWRTASPAAEVLSPQRPMSSRSVMDAAGTTQGGTTVALPHGHASRAGPPPPFVPPQRSSSSSSHSWRTVRPFLSDDNLLPAFLFPGGGVGLHRPPLPIGGGGGVGGCCDADAPSPSRSDSTLSTASRHTQHSGSLSSRPLTATSQHPDGGGSGGENQATAAATRCDPSSSTTVATPSSFPFSRSWRWLHRLPLRVFTGAVHELKMVWSTCRGNAKRVAARCRGLWAHWKHRLLLLGCIRK